MLQFSLEPTIKLYEALKRKGPRIAEVLRVKMDALLFQLGSKIVTTKLRGQSLRWRSGTLARSVHVVPAQFQGAKLVGKVVAGDGPAFYGKFFEDQEHGGTGGVPHSWKIMATKARALRFMVDGKKRFAKSVVHPPLAEKAFMGPSENEFRSRYQKELQAAIDAELET